LLSNPSDKGTTISRLVGKRFILGVLLAISGFEHFRWEFFRVQVGKRDFFGFIQAVVRFAFQFQSPGQGLKFFIGGSVRRPRIIIGKLFMVFLGVVERRKVPAESILLLLLVLG